MKYLILFMLMGLIQLKTFAQAPNLINFQGQARGENGAVVSNKTIAIRIFLRSQNTTGPIFYSETRSVQTNNTGLFSFQIGSPGASNVSGSLTMPSSANFCYIHTEMDVNNGTAFIHVGTELLSSVPYSKYADVVTNLSSKGSVKSNQLGSDGAALGNILMHASSAQMRLVPVAPPSLVNTMPALVTAKITHNNAAVPAFGITNTGTGPAIQVNGTGNARGILMYGGQAGIKAENNSPTTEAMRVSNGGLGSAISTFTDGQWNLGVLASAEPTGYAIRSNGKIRFRGGAKPAQKGTIATCNENGELLWVQTKVGCKVNSIGSTERIGKFQTGGFGSTNISFKNEEFDSGNYMNTDNGFATIFTAPDSGYFNVTGNVTVSSTDGSIFPTPALEEATIFARIVSLNGSVTNQTLATKKGTYGLASQINLGFDTEIRANAGDKIHFVVSGSSESDIYFSNPSLSINYAGPNPF